MVRYLLISLVTLLLLVGIGSYIMGGLLSAPHYARIDKSQYDLPLEDVAIDTPRGNRLYGWYLRGGREKGGILLMHGVRSNRIQMADRAKWLHARGYSVLLFDFQAHGESRGEHISFGYLEAQDAQSAYSYLEKRLETKKIAVIGVSLGGAAALLGDIGQQCQALILESVYPTLEEAIANRIAIRFGDVGRYFAPLLLVQIGPRLGFDPDGSHPIGHIGRLSAPVMIISGAEDRHTTRAESVRMYEQARMPKELWIVPGAKHQDIYRFAPREYEIRVGRFIDRYLE